MKYAVKKWIWGILFALYLVVLLKLTVFRGNTYAYRILNLKLFVALADVYRRHGLRQFLWLFGGNIGCFVPFGFLLPVLWRRAKFWHIAAAGFAFSLAIEATQYIFRVGIAELDDLILNTLGVVTGYALYGIVLRKNPNMQLREIQR